MMSDDSQGLNQTNRSDLRTRIANALRHMTGDLTYEAMADAVIRELGLEIERGGTYAIGGEATSHRYVTEWKINDE